MQGKRGLLVWYKTVAVMRNCHASLYVNLIQVFRMQNWCCFNLLTLSQIIKAKPASPFRAVARKKASPRQCTWQNYDGSNVLEKNMTEQCPWKNYNWAYKKLPEEISIKTNNALGNVHKKKLWLRQLPWFNTLPRYWGCLWRFKTTKKETNFWGKYLVLPATACSLLDRLFNSSTICP